MSELLNSLGDGLVQGATYSLLALGFVIIFKATQVVSFAQPGLMVLGGLVGYHAIAVIGLPFWVGLPVAVAGGAIIGMICERLTLRPMIGKPVFTLAIITVGLDVVLRIFANRYIGSNPKIVSYDGDSDQALVAVTVVVVALLLLFFRYSRWGLAMRATSLDQETAMAQGVRVSVVFALSWAIAGGLGAIAGTFLATQGSGLDQTTWAIALTALPAIIIGGLDSLPGAVVGGLLVGVVESLSAVYQPDVAPWLGNNFAVVAPFALMFVVLLIRPHGLFGTKEVERV